MPNSSRWYRPAVLDSRLQFILYILIMIGLKGLNTYYWNKLLLNHCMNGYIFKILCKEKWQFLLVIVQNMQVLQTLALALFCSSVTARQHEWYQDSETEAAKCKIQPSLILLHTPLFYYCDMSKCLHWNNTQLTHNLL